MPRLLAFGCSYTYGHGLPDCFVEPMNAGPVSSKFAWPELLAEKLGYQCLNLSAPGSGNLQILMEVLKTEFNKSDLVVLAFSYFSRFNMFQLIDTKGAGQIIKQETLQHKELILESLGKRYSDVKSYWDNWLAIHHCEKFLDSMGVRNISFLNLPVGAQENKPEILQLLNFKNDLKLIDIDKALDNKHSGLESHKLQSELIYNKIREYELR